MFSNKYQKMYNNLIEVCKKNLGTFDEKLIRNAFEFALEAHKNDLRASGEPYFDHPYEVAMIIAKEIPLDDISIASALLHDVLEDTEITYETLVQHFNPTVAEIVDGVTKIGGVIRDHDASQAENYRKLLLSMVKDIRVILVKFADRLHNMRTLEFLSREKQIRIAKETMQIYVPFAHRFGLAQIRWELEDLSFKYLDPEAYEDIRKKLKATRREREAYIKKTIAPIKQKLDEEGLKYEIEGRPKHFYSIYRKMINRGKSFEEIYDLFAIRIILDTENIYECYNVLGIITQIYRPVPDRLHDYIALPKSNNYQSLHTTVVGPDGKMVEIQIRTRRMHEIAEKGVAAHWKYKNSYKPTDKEIEEWVDWIRDIFENVSSREEANRDIIESFKLNLYQDEIFVFTPKGDLKVLPKGATPVDFAFQIHTKVGFHCIGAKVNGKIVPLDTKLNSGDQVEIITSKNQTPNRSWEKFVVTSKAKQEIRKWIRQQENKQVEEGKNLFAKVLKKLKIHINNDDLLKLVHKHKFDNLNEFFKAVAAGSVDVEQILVHKTETEKITLEEEAKKLDFEKFADSTRAQVGGVLIAGDKLDILHNFAKCCNPIPGDEILGFITRGEGIKIHRKNCKNLDRLMKFHEGRIIEVNWPNTDGNYFIAAIKIIGEDRPGMLSEISQTIVNTQNTNIKSVNIQSHRNIFYGTISVSVKNLEHLNRIIERLRKITGIETVERFEVSN
ncbi:MAG: bifunctional (p)ppGpp synthetase/guanosine-3',5'-bis(diphosphate) 3'-pyrophosphohydrolase [Ignavibacteria bacterium]|jgi:RelA/SpoT family (p)ppGpp synthetase|nr:bifunctional (p)ppGpp synthetase/guanosine-3',5'-bis(diphosphate) 3'-pyrophosphohydrolase [Ignavibacteria bacterium]MDH7528476.1 bifunctional (p)ppGpp synthetase/guanosine-3',5'-bis(diphosphate) 3'-pyrophosphohydrolase [Ignavibacteria bacterium]